MMHLQALKHPNRPHYEWSGERLEQNDEYVMVLCQPGRKLIHHTKKSVFIMDNTSLELFFLKEWFTVAIGIEDGKAVSYYCNVAMPSIVTETGISFVDLDLDLIKQPGEDWKVVDEDEFASNSIILNYSAELQTSARAALARLLERAVNGIFPFDEHVLGQLPAGFNHQQ
ncbi:DUF402 domain-containing protein [Paenibacillus sp. F411]|nr:DUF402 domain-containing protein [Paenibacillus sp. F411]